MSDHLLLLAMMAAFFWGLKHGIDWDHIAAISDITSSVRDTRSGIFLGTLYALGHAVVVTILGLLAIAFGIKLPAWLQMNMSYFVGTTLILLGIYVVIAYFRTRSSTARPAIKSRLWVLLNGISHGYEHVRAIITRTPRRVPRRFLDGGYMPATATGVGVIHGLGAESPTQVALFASAAGFTGGYNALLLLLAFIIGMLITNTTVIIASGLGYLKAGENERVYGLAVAVTAVYSLVIGTTFLLNASGL